MRCCLHTAQHGVWKYPRKPFPLAEDGEEPKAFRSREGRSKTEGGAEWLGEPGGPAGEERQNQARPGPTNSPILRMRPPICVLTRPPGDWGASNT